MSNKHVHSDVLKTFCEIKVNLAENGGVHIYKRGKLSVTMFVPGEPGTPPCSELKNQIASNKNVDVFKFLDDKFNYSPHNFTGRLEAIDTNF